MLRRVGLRNFKCFERLDLDCAPLNLLCGMNGMGKSSVMEALLVLRQSMDGGHLERGRLLLGGERVDLGTGADVLFEDASSDTLRFVLAHEAGGGSDVWGMEFDCSGGSDSLYARDNVPLAVRPVESSGSDPGPSPGSSHDDVPGPSGDLRSWRDVPPIGGQLVHLNAERALPRSTYLLPDALAGRGALGSDMKHATHRLSRQGEDLLAEDNPRCGMTGRRIFDVAEYWLQEICPGACTQPMPVSDAGAVVRQASGRNRGLESGRHRSARDGIGVSYALPVIMALLSPPGTLCLIESPEAHLHPLGQTRMGELAARSVRAGVQVFGETHSEYFMDGVRIAIREGLIEPEDAVFHHFERDGKGSVVTSLRTDSDGRISGWPAGFFDQHVDNLARLIAPRPQHAWDAS